MMNKVTEYLTDNEKFIGYEDEKGKQGEWRLYENSILKRVVNYKDDFKHGSFISYYSTGKIEVSTFYKNGKPDGDWTEWYQNGQKKEYGVYIDDDYKPIHYWGSGGRQFLINGEGIKIECFGFNELDIYKHVFVGGELIKEEKISSLEHDRLMELPPEEPA